MDPLTPYEKELPMNQTTETATETTATETTETAAEVFGRRPQVQGYTPALPAEVFRGDLNSNSHAKRRAALAAFEQRTREVADDEARRLQQEIAKVRAKAAAECDAATKAVTERFKALSRSVAERFVGAAVDCAQAYTSAPREAARKLAACVREGEADAQNLTGEALDSRLVGHAFALAAGFGDRVGAPEFWQHVAGRKAAGAAYELTLRCLEGAPDVVVDSACRDLELAIAKECYAASSDPERSQAMRSHSVARLNTAAAEEVHRARKEARRDADVAAQIAARGGDELAPVEPPRGPVMSAVADFFGRGA